ncbi:MAG: 4-hydroxy-tetrahydrodipicolinate synthase [Nitrospinaceae bacterium]
MFEGSLVAIVTPFKNGKVDEKSLRELIEFQIAGGTRGIVPCGTTGESATLSHDEHDEVIHIAVDACKKRVPVLAGTGSNSTLEAIELTQHAQKAGADGSLLITPYYNKPSQEGLVLHFTAVAKETDLPIILYNVPGRTSVNMLPPTVKRLSAIGNIVGIKEASGSLQQIGQIISLCGPEFTVLSGDDPLLWPILSIGGKGVISVTANILPDKVSRLCEAAARGNMEEARALHYDLLEINEALFIDTNPVPVKAALAVMGKIGGELRSPLAPLSDNALERLKSALHKHCLATP